VVSIESVRGTSPTVREGSVKRESMILTEQHVLDCFFHISFLPQINRTSVARPWFDSSWQRSGFSQSPCRVRLEGIENWLRIAECSNN